MMKWGDDMFLDIIFIFALSGNVIIINQNETIFADVSFEFISHFFGK